MVEHVAIERLSPAPWNPREVRSERFSQLCRSLEADPAFLEQRPILANAQGVVYAGNHRLLAARHLGWTTVPAILADVPDLLAKQRGMLDNNNAADWVDLDLSSLLGELETDGTDLSLLGFEAGELDRLLALSVDDADGPLGDDPGPQIDRADELREKWQTERGQLWLIGKHRLLCGDSTSADDVARLMGGERAQGVFTSPPYAEQRKEQYGGTPADEYVDWWEAIQFNVSDVLASDGSFFVNIKAHCDDGERSLYVMDLVLAMKRQWGWKYVDEFCWLNPAVPGAYPNRFKDGWEPVYHFTRGALKFRPRNVTHESDDVFSGPGGMDGRGGGGSYIPSTGERTTGQALPSNVVSTGSGDGGHPAAFPIALPTFFLKAFSDAGDVWFEPFSGSATLLVSAEQTGRCCYGLEIEPKYVAVALERLAQMGLSPRLG